MNTTIITSLDQCKTIDDVRAYHRYRAKIWYQQNKEKKQEYQRNYYYKKKTEKAKNNKQ